MTAPYTTETAYAGEGSVDLWLRSTAVDTDLETTLTIVRPDGQETYVQSGWLRASLRKLDPGKSTELYPFHTFLQSDAQDLPAGQFVPVRVELFPFATVLRPGDRLRLNIEAPGGNQPFWQFADLPAVGHEVDDIGHSVGMPSRVVLPLLPTALLPEVPAADPPCPSLRNQPCRAYLPARVPTDVVATVVGNGVHVTWAPPDTTDAVDAYQVTVEPTHQTLDVAGTATSVDLPSVTHDTAYTFRVAARFGATVAPQSDASLAVEIADAPATTTTSAAPTTTAASTPPTQLAAGTLPHTGTDSAPWAFAGAALVAGGGGLLVASRRRRRLPT